MGRLQLQGLFLNFFPSTAHFGPRERSNYLQLLTFPDGGQTRTK